MRCLVCLRIEFPKIDAASTTQIPLCNATSDWAWNSFMVTKITNLKSFPSYILCLSFFSLLSLLVRDVYIPTWSFDPCCQWFKYCGLSTPSLIFSPSKPTFSPHWNPYFSALTWKPVHGIRYHHSFYFAIPREEHWHRSCMVSSCLLLLVVAEVQRCSCLFKAVQCYQRHLWSTSKIWYRCRKSFAWPDPHWHPRRCRFRFTASGGHKGASLSNVCSTSFSDNSSLTLVSSLSIVMYTFKINLR